MKSYAKYMVLAVAALVIAIIATSGRKPVNEGGVAAYFTMRMGPVAANAADIAQPAVGSHYQPLGAPNGCSGSGTLAAGTLQVTADCLKGFPNGLVQVTLQPSAPGTPAAMTVNGAPTSTTTGSPAATHTVVIFNASTANATPGIVWQAVN